MGREKSRNSKETEGKKKGKRDGDCWIGKSQKSVFIPSFFETLRRSVEYLAGVGESGGGGEYSVFDFRLREPGASIK